MFRRLGLFLTVLAALAVVPAASAAFPAPFALQGGQGVLSNRRHDPLRRHAAGESTLVRASRRTDGSILMSQSVHGSFGVPMLTSSGPGGGMFRDGSTFVLQSMGSLRDDAVRPAPHRGSRGPRPDRA